MASADLRKELECPVCLSIYADPVMLKCGHNFCRDCVDRVLDTQEASGGYSCPECRQRFQARPALHRNITLRNIAESFQSAHPDQNESGIFCTYCIHASVPAVKSCVMCEASLCDNHLRVHCKSPEHVLLDPTTSLEKRKCSVHKKILEYYCTEDSTYICVSCSLAGEHRGHQVTTLDEAFEMKKKKLRKVLQKLMTEREETEKKVQSLQDHMRRVQREEDDETERLAALFRDIMTQLGDLEKRVVRDISGQARLIPITLGVLMQQLKMKKDELSWKMKDIEELCNTTDPLTILQKPDIGDLCDTEDGDDEESDAGVLCDAEDGDDEDTERYDTLLHDYDYLDVTAISNTLYTGLCDIMFGENVQEYADRHVYPPKKKVRLSASAEGPNIGAAQQTSGVTDILLDMSTAGSYLLLSDDRKTVSLASYQCHLETPGRFQCNQVLSSQSFSSGQHYWEVNVGVSDEWIVGMCYPSINRRGSHSQIGYNKKSWGLKGKRRFWFSQYSVVHDRKEHPLPGKASSYKIRIDLDYEAGRLSFYELCEPIRHLHTFTTTFTEPLHAVLCAEDHSYIKIIGGNRM